MNQIPDALIFDLDGTLVDSEEPGMDVLYEEALKLGVPITREQAHAEFRGRRMAECIDYIATRMTRVPAEFEGDFAPRFTAHVRQTQAQRFRADLSAMPGALALVARLERPFCIATNGPREKAELTLGLTGLLPWFEGRLYSAYEVGSFKPDPGLFLHAAQALGVAPAHCAVVEDSLPGIAAGLAAGMQVHALCPPENVPADLAAGVRFIASLEELDQALHG
ncbi:HAD-IA family hydrolase [Ramlibacter sp. 2FC]|uniref:HAD family hydrolase n=1 Tax=Ramlibacter sp. 2FC TaxID=2502188 RepID=UPI00201E0118|nr:HAD-IA family hydrolase [Ramlibacter sp. 2FC]